MDSFNDVLDAAKAYCREHTADATYQYYISGLKAVSFENSNCITLEVRNDFICKIVSDRYTGLLKDAFKAVLGFDVEVKFTVPQPEPEAAKEKRPMDEASLPSGRYDFTFENFIRGPSNQFAFAAAQAVAANPSGAYNPLFIYGPSGLGKTHLLNAIQIEIHKNHPDYNIVYVDCEKFTNEIITAVKMATTEQFRQKYREADVLLIDDIQFIAKGDTSQEELFHTFNSLWQNQKQIIFTSDRTPKSIPNLEDRLCSRFQQGLVVQIEKPDYETRVAILRDKVGYIADQIGYHASVDDDVLYYIASKEDTNIRELEGALKMLFAHAQLMNTEKEASTITMDLAVGALTSYIIEPKEKVITPDLVIKTVCSYYDISAEDMTGKRKNKEISYPRQIAMYLLYSMCNLTYKKIAELTGRKDHTTVLYAVEKLSDRIKTDTSFKNTIEDIKHKIKE